MASPAGTGHRVSQATNCHPESGPCAEQKLGTRRYDGAEFPAKLPGLSCTPVGLTVLDNQRVRIRWSLIMTVRYIAGF
jgi:hypothetical protein